MEEKKGSRRRGRKPTPIPVTHALIGEEEQTGRAEYETEERNRERDPNPTYLFLTVELGSSKLYSSKRGQNPFKQLGLSKGALSSVQLSFQP